MARMNDLCPIVGATAAASAGTTYAYVPTGTRPFQVRDMSFFWIGSEGNVDNTFDFVIDYTVDGSTWVPIYTNGNAVGLADTGVALLQFVNKADAAAGGGAAVAVTAPTTRIPANAIVRFTHVRAGTGTIPAIQQQLSGLYV